MQFRMIARRAPSGSVTVLGDLAQATGPWTYADWDEVRASPARRRPAPSRRADAGLPGTGPRPRLRLAPAARGRSGSPAHLVHPAGPHRSRPSARGARGRAGCRPRWHEGTRAGRRTMRWWRSSSPRTSCPRSPGWPGGHAGVGLLERDAMTRPVTIVPAPAAKGLEFDAVVVVEPAAIAGDDRRGLRLLYVAMTRPDPAPQRRARPARSPPRSSAERSAFPYDRSAWHSTSTARSPSSPEGATASVRASPGIWPAGAHGS